MSLDLIEAVLRETASNIALYSSRPHRMFREPPEPLPALHRRLEALYDRSRYRDPDYLEELAVQYVSAVAGDLAAPNATVCASFAPVILELMVDNKLAFAFPPLQKLDDAAQVQLRVRLQDLEPYLLHEQRIRDLFGRTVCLVLLHIAEQVPADTGSSLTAPLHTVIDTVDLIERLLGTFLDETAFPDDYPASLTFAHTRARLVLNVLAASGMTPEQAHNSPQRLVPPRNSKLSGEELIRAYLGGTPFEAYLGTDVPVAIPRHAYREHGAIFAPAGHGKTQLLQHLIADFINSDDPPGMFILDSQGDMLGKIERLAVFDRRLKERLVILDPEDQVPPALNFFHLGSRADAYDAQIQELFSYLFTAIDSDLTAKQGTAITYLLRLMRTIDGATIETLKDVMEEQAKSLESSKYHDAISKLDRITQDFFRNQFFDKAAMGATRQQVARRLYTILGNPVFTRMFAARENRFNARRAMEERKIVLINTSQRFLGQEASAVFGRFMIAQCLAAAYDRADIPEAERHLTLLVVDEASEYFDAKTERILSQARKYGLGLIFATQYLEQMPPQVKAAVNGNTAIKLAGPVSHTDAMMLAREMYTTGDFIRSMRKTAAASQFAGYVRGMTSQAVALTVPFGTLERQPTLTEDVRLAIRAANRERYGSTTLPAPEQPPAAAAPALSPDDAVHTTPKPWGSS